MMKSHISRQKPSIHAALRQLLHRSSVVETPLRINHEFSENSVHRLHIRHFSVPIVQRSKFCKVRQNNSASCRLSQPHAVDKRLYIHRRMFVHFSFATVSIGVWPVATYWPDMKGPYL